MLKKVTNEHDTRYVDFTSITTTDSVGSGRCYVYNAVMKRSKSGSPFVTLYMRDIFGATLPGYIFNLDTPIMAGLDLELVKGSVVEIDWQENFIHGYGMTIKIQKVSVVQQPEPEELAKFTGRVENVNGMLQEIADFAGDIFKVRLTMPTVVKSLALDGFSHGRVGGLAEHYWRMLQIIKTMRYIGEEEFKQLVATYILFIFVHHLCLRAERDDSNDINFTIDVINKIAPLMEGLHAGEGAKELLSVVLKNAPKDIYAKTVVSVSNLVKQVDNEFTMYQTLPLLQEGDAGYGKIRRYPLEGEKSQA